LALSEARRQEWPRSSTPSTRLITSPKGGRGWRVRITAIALTIALAGFTLISFALVMVGPAPADQVASGLGLGPLVAWGWKVVQWPVAFALVATALGFVYHFAPDVEQKWVWLTPGSVTATALWLLSSLGNAPAKKLAQRSALPPVATSRNRSAREAPSA
jgi:hypothetical protein